MKNTELRKRTREQLKADLARLVNCEPSELPVSIDKETSAQFLHLTNPKTFNVWNTAGRHGIVMLKRGRSTEPTTDWLIEYALSGLSVTQEVA